MLTSETIIGTDSETQAETDLSLWEKPMLEQQPPKCMDGKESKSHQRNTGGIVHEERKQKVTDANVYRHDHVYFMVSLLVVVVAIVMYKYFNS